MFLRPLFALLLTAFATSALSAQGAAPRHIVPVVLKLDDVRTNDRGWLSDRWKRLGELAKEKNIKMSFGVIADSLEGDKPAYFAWLKEMHASGRVELWFHGYDHGVRAVGETEAPEFAARSFDEQKERFDKSQKLAREKLGFPFTAYGPPGGGKLAASDADRDASARVLTEDPDMKVWLYPSPMDDRGHRLNDAGKVTVLDRVWQVNIEQPLFLPNYDKFVTGYDKFAAQRRYFVVQGHPGKWDDARWAEFVKIVDYLVENKIPTVLPTELAESLKKPKS